MGKNSEAFMVNFISSYSSDLAPSDFHLFRMCVVSKFIKWKNVNNDAEIDELAEKYFCFKIFRGRNLTNYRLSDNKLHLIIENIQQIKFYCK